MARRTAAALIAVLTWMQLGMAAPLRGDRRNGFSSRVVEIRVYTLKPGVRGRFHDLFVHDALPMLRRRHVDVIAYGPSLHDANSYFLIRAFNDADDRTRTEDAFYGSAEWINGPRDAVLAAIETYSTVVAPVDDETLGALRRLGPASVSEDVKGDVVTQESLPAAVMKATDIASLLALNEDYIRAVRTSDVRRFREILADDFLCSLPDGTEVDRAAFLERIAAPATIANLEVHDVNVRVFGDFALVHARTTFSVDGRAGRSRYTDAWARRNGRWLAVAAHVTRY